jgi:alanyl aminopeptidase
VEKTLLAVIIAFASLCAAGSVFAQTLSTGDSTPPAFRLPNGARPLHYDLMLTIVPGDPKASGEIAIDVELTRPHPVLWLNADSLTISSASVNAPQARVAILSGHDQFVGLAFEPPLPPGTHRLTVAFEAEQSRNSTRGIFTLEEGGASYTMTQFEAVSARRAFPCFDEPGFKVPWRLTLRVPRDVVALSNTPIDSEVPSADGLKTVRFGETRPLPSYLVAFAVGPWQFVDVGRIGVKTTPMRIIVPRGRLADAEFVAGAYPQLFGQLEKWFGIPYPYEKLDHIAIPLSVSFAMENVGLITYGATGLLAKRGAATARFRRGAANIGAHEMAHHWFGNLVTLAWWDDIWLNEAFATWIAEKTVNQWRPDYDRGAARVEERAQAIDADALVSARRIREPVNSRGDIFNAFDYITYQKGATVIGMFEGWIGEEKFRRGVHAYLESRPDGSATADDFLQALTRASRMPVAPAFNTFLNQNGVPQIDVTLHCAPTRTWIDLKQRRLALLGTNDVKPQQWQIPVCARYGSGNASRQACGLMTEETKALPLQGGCPSFVFANASGRGYYVPDYRGDLLAKLAMHRDSLTAAEYASLVHDLRALLRAGSVSGAQAMDWIRMAGTAHDRHVVLAAIDLADFVRDTLVTDVERPRFSAFAREVFGPRARALGFAPNGNESDDDQLMRRTVLRFVGREDPQLAAEARNLALAWIKNRGTINPGMVEVVLTLAGQTGDATMFDALLAEAKTTSDGLDRRNLMTALFSFTDPTLAKKGMSLLLEPGFDARESWTALRNSFYANATRRETNEYIMTSFDALTKTVAKEAPGFWPHFASGLCSEKDRADVEAFWKERAKNYPGAERELAQALEGIALCTRLRSAQGNAIAQFSGTKP